MNSIKDIKLLTRAQIKGKWLMLLVAEIILGILMQVPVLGSMTKIGLAEIHEDVSKGDEVNFDRLFSWFNSNWWKPFVLDIVKYLLIGIGTLLFIIPGIYLAISYQFAGFILRDNPDMEITECLRESRRIVSNNFGNVFIFPFTFILWMFGVCLTSGILGIYFQPYFGQAHYNYYKFLIDDFNPESKNDDFSEFGL